jgi:hypothetical protein
MTSCMFTNAPANRQGNVPSWLPILEGWRCLPRTLKAQIGSQTLSAKTPSRNVSLPARKANLLTSTKPPSLSELTYGGISAVTSHLNGRWGYKRGAFLVFRYHNLFVSELHVLPTSFGIQ